MQCRKNEVLAIRRIEECELKWLERVEASQCGRVAPPDPGSAGEGEILDVLAQKSPRFDAVINEKAKARAAGQSFQTHCAGPGEEIDHTGASHGKVPELRVVF